MNWGSTFSNCGVAPITPILPEITTINSGKKYLQKLFKGAGEWANQTGIEVWLTFGKGSSIEWGPLLYSSLPEDKHQSVPRGVAETQEIHRVAC